MDWELLGWGGEGLDDVKSTTLTAIKGLRSTLQCLEQGMTRVGAQSMLSRSVVSNSL